MIEVEPEIQKQLDRWRTGEDPPLWIGAVPDVHKLQASTQTNPELWWGDSGCDLCIYQADVYYLGVYYCLAHWDLFS